jgi:WD40-like Beta Propeller Repeat
VKGRDLLILGAVLLVVGFAVADSLRSDESRIEARPATTEPAEGATTTTEAPDENLGRELFPEVSGAPGSIVLAQTGSCAIREVDLPTGIELPNVVERSTCQLWAAPVTTKVAVGIGEPVGDAVPFRFLDLGRPGRDLGNSEAAFGFLVWSEDGQRAAWCNGRFEGIDLELDGPRRRLDGCPAAYTPDGDIVYARGDRLYIEERPGLRATGGITGVHYGNDGSVAVIVDGERIERYVEERLTHRFDLPERYEGRLPVLSPDNCSAAFRAGDRVRILDVGCSPFGRQGGLFFGHTAAWSPDGRWLVVGGAAETTFYNLVEGGEPVVWPIGAAQIVWRRS